MSDKQKPLRRGPDKPDTPDQDETKTPAERGDPVSTGDMQKVGALTPEEVQKRRNVVPDEAPVEEEPGNQESG